MSKKYKSSSSGGPAPILFFHLKSDTIAPACIRELRAAGLPVAEVLMEEYGMGGVRLIEPDSWEKVLLSILSQRPLAIVLLNSKGMDDGSFWLAMAELLRVPVFNWFTDHPRFCPLAPVEQLSEALQLVLWDRAYIEEMRACGYKQARALPLAGDREAAQRLASKDPLTPPCDVAFVGSLGLSRLASFRQEISGILEVYRCPGAMPRIEGWIEKGRQWARENKGRSIFEFANALETAALTGAQDEAPAKSAEADEDKWQAPSQEQEDAQRLKRLIAAAIDFENMREDRLRLVHAMRGKGLCVWGDQAWEKELSAEQYRGFIPYEEVGRVYRDARIIVNCSRDQLLTTVNQRVFDVPLSGGFLITDWRDDLGQFVEPESEMAVYRGLDDLEAQIDRYLKAPEERARMSEAAARRIAENHTYRHRMATLIEWAREAAAQFSSRPPQPLHEQWEMRLNRAADALWSAGAHDAHAMIAAEIERRGAGSPYGILIQAKADIVKKPANLVRAIERLLMACRSGANLPEARHLLGQALANTNRLVEMQPLLLALPENMRVATDWEWLGYLRLEQRNRREALKAFDRAFELNPSNPRLLEIINKLTGVQQ
ncbi:MAG: glycosyltransferase [Candidatus Sumerlaeota bacterium]|nr:glycosyltransferase [Candidatus Sumerlaeota bacterium]